MAEELNPQLSENELQAEVIREELAVEDAVTAREYEETEYARQLEQDREAGQKNAGGEEQAQNASAPISLFLFLPLLILCLIGDIIDVMTVGTVGWIIGLFIDGIMMIALGLSRSGRKQFRRIVIGVIGDSIPILAVFPFRTIFLCWGFMKSRSKIVSGLDSHLALAFKAKHELV